MKTDDKRTSNNKKPCTVGVNSYPSLADACKAFGVRCPQVRYRVKRYDLSIEQAMYQIMTTKKLKPYRKLSKVCTVNGVKFDSKVAACKHFQLTKGTVFSHIKKYKVSIETAINNVLENHRRVLETGMYKPKNTGVDFYLHRFKIRTIA